MIDTIMNIKLPTIKADPNNSIHDVPTQTGPKEIGEDVSENVSKDVTEDVSKDDNGNIGEDVNVEVSQ